MKNVILSFSIVTILTIVIYESLANKPIAPPSTPPIVEEIKDSNKTVSSAFSYKSIDYNDVSEINTPDGYSRIKIDSGSFADYLRHLPFKKNHDYVLLYDGSMKGYQGSQLKVVDIDVGTQDLQQCADAVLRLKAEHQLKSGDKTNIGFHFLNGDYCDYSKYAEGYRVKVDGWRTSWHKTAAPDYSYKGFKKYMTLVFNFCNTHSMIKEMENIKVQEMKIGDVFIRKSGDIGHAMVVVDMAINAEGKKVFMLAQSYMPAQEIHVVVNPYGTNDSPWYSLDFGTLLDTPEWAFTDLDLYRFKK